MIVYDATFKESFDSAKNWVQDLRQNCNVPDVLIALVGNKCDLTEKLEVTFEEADSFKREVKGEIFRETSAKDNNGVNELFQEIALKLYKRHKAKEVRI